MYSIARRYEKSLKISLLIVGKGRRKPSYFRLTRQYEDSPSCGNLQSFILLRLNVNRGHVEHLKPSNLVCLEWRTHNIKLEKRKWNRARFDVLTAVLVKTAVFWDVTPCWVARWGVRPIAALYTLNRPWVARKWLNRVVLTEMEDWNDTVDIRYRYTYFGHCLSRHAAQHSTPISALNKTLTTRTLISAD